jgi:peroxiredoxin
MSATMAEFDGSLKSFHAICKLLGIDLVAHFSDWKQLEVGNELDVTINGTIHRVHRGDILIKQNGSVRIIEGSSND